MLLLTSHGSVSNRELSKTKERIRTGDVNTIIITVLLLLLLLLLSSLFMLV